MKNKRLAIFLIILTILTVFVILSSAIFSLKFVEIKFLSSTNALTDTEHEIVESGNFKYGENVFFSSKSNT